MNRSFVQKGFSLVELLVVIVIISLLVVVVIVNYQEARKQARDELRKTHIEQLSSAIVLFREKYDRWPYCDYGVIIEQGGNGGLSMRGNNSTLTDEDGVGSGCEDKTLLMDFLTDVAFKELPSDPLGPGNVDYLYYYDSAHICEAGENASMVFASNLEVEQSNKATECPAPGGNDGGFDDSSYYNGGTIGTSQPYVIRVNRY